MIERLSLWTLFLIILVPICVIVPTLLDFNSPFVYLSRIIYVVAGLVIVVISVSGLLALLFFLRDLRYLKHMCNVFPIENTKLSDKQRELVIYEIRFMLKYTLLVDKTPWSGNSLTREEMKRLLWRVKSDTLYDGDVVILNSIVYVGAAQEDAGIVPDWWVSTFIDNTMSVVRRLCGGKSFSEVDVQAALRSISSFPTFPGTTENARRSVCTILPDSRYIFTASNAYGSPNIVVRNRRGHVIASKGERSNLNTHMVEEMYAHVKLLYDLGLLKEG